MNNYFGFRIANEEVRTEMTLNLTNSMSSEVMQAKIDQLPRYLETNLTIQFEDGTYVPTDGFTLQFGGFSGPGTLTIQGNSSESGLHTNQAVIFTLGLTHMANWFKLSNCSCPVIVKNFRFNRSNPVSTWWVSVVPYLCYDVSVTGCCFNGQNQASRSVFAEFSNAKVYNNYVGAHETLAFGYNCSNIMAWDNDDMAADNKPGYVYAIGNGATLGYYGTTPAYVTALTSIGAGSVGRLWA